MTKPPRKNTGTTNRTGFGDHDETSKPRRKARRWSQPGLPGEEVVPASVGETLEAVSAELGLGDSVTLVALTGQWVDLVGPALAEHTELRSLRDRTLTIAVHAGPWATELKYLRSELRDRVSAVTGPDRIRDVRVVVEAPPPDDPGYR